MPACPCTAFRSQGFPMLRAFGCRPNPLRTACGFVRILACFLCGLGMASSIASAQPTGALPAAPEPQSPPFVLFAQTAPYRLALAPAQDGIGRKSTDMSPVGHEPQDSPIVAMFSRPESSSWWLSGQANIIFQGRLPFHSLYQGVNSFRNSAE